MKKMKLIIFILALISLVWSWNKYLVVEKKYLKERKKWEKFKVLAKEAVKLMKKNSILKSKREKVKGVLTGIQKIISQLNLSSKLLSVKVTENTKISDYQLEVASLKMSGLSLNQFINFFYRLEFGKMPLFLKSVHVSLNQNKSFDLESEIKLVKEK